MILEPTVLQQGFIESPAKETLFGGSRGGGKTFAIFIDWLTHSNIYARDARGIVFRRTLIELDDFIESAKDIFGAAGHEWKESKKSFIAPNGAVFRCRYLENDNEASLYQGHQYTRVYVEEIGNFPNEAPIKKILACLRSAKGVPCQFKATANPGGAGHTWVKARYIDPAPPMTPFSDDGGKTYRLYIPAKLTDNPHLMENDPGYIDMIKQAGDAELVRAWLDGDWDVVVGQYFKEWSRARHVIPTVALPSTWTVRYRAMDWGSARPFAVYWFAVADGSALPGIKRTIPRGALVVYRELYGWNGTPNVGCRETAGQVGRRIAIAEAEDSDIIRDNGGLNKIDPSTFATNGGPSIAETMAREAGIWWTRADNRRVAQIGALGGWDQVRARLRGEEEDGSVPMIYFMDCCIHAIRTIPTLPRDSNKLDDIDTDTEDHAADAIRYGCMARMYTPPPPRNVLGSGTTFVRSLSEFSLEDAWATQISKRSDTILRN
jgi:hypothetical protein